MGWLDKYNDWRKKTEEYLSTHDIKGNRIPDDVLRKNREESSKQWSELRHKLDNTTMGAIYKFIDPTGISSWADINKAWSDNKFDYQDVLEPVSAIPVVKYASRPLKFLHGLTDVTDLGLDIHQVNQSTPERLNLSKSTNFTPSIFEDGGEIFPTRKERLMRQAFAESSWREGKVKSGAGALGPLQIMPNLYKDYVKATGDKTPYEKVKEFPHAVKVRNWKLDDAAEAEYIKNRPNTQAVRLAKQYAEYNMGRSALINELNKAKKQGMDIYKGLDWVKLLPDETKGYLNKVLFKNDPAFEQEFMKVSRTHPNREWFESYEDGGNIQNPKGLTNFTQKSGWLDKYREL